MTTRALFAWIRLNRNYVRDVRRYTIHAIRTTSWRLDTASWCRWWVARKDGGELVARGKNPVHPHHAPTSLEGAFGNGLRDCGSR